MGFCKTICEIITVGIPILLAIALFPIAKDLITHSEFRAVTIRPQFDATPGQQFYLLDVTAERAVGIPSGLFSAPNPFANFFLKDDSLHSYATFPVFSTVNPVFIPEWTATFVVAPATDAGKALVDKAVLTAEIYANEFKPKLLGTAELSLKGLVNKEGETIDTWQELKDDKGKNAGRFNFRYVLRKAEQPPARTDPFYIHVIFFDYDADGIIDSKGTEAACKQLGFSDSIAWFLGAAIPPVLPSNLVSRLTHGVRHDDSNSWHHSDGKWDEISFNAYFAEADLNQDGYLSTYETLSSSWRVTRHDVPQFLGSLAELVLAHAVMADKQGLMSKDQLRGFLDGSLYTKLINERKH